MFLLRTLSSISLIALFSAAIFWKGPGGKALFAVWALFFGFFAVRECLKMFKAAGKDSYTNFGSACGGLTLALCLYLPFEKVLISAAVLMVMLFWINLLFSKNRLEILEKSLHTLAGAALPIIPLSFLGGIYTLDENAGRFFILFLVLVTKSGDVGAYVVGSLSNKLLPGGNHKVTPNISPKKSWEGVFGGIALSIACAYFLSSFVIEGCKLGRLEYSLMMGALLYLGGFYGDLAESAMKRIVGVKDSGASIPGIGGVMDLLDSLLLNTPAYFFCIQLLHCAKQ